ncbi:helix-turn-helix domain-containing protein [Bartonella vinsonii]|uniref:Anaerobic benzoate catabolism transcriptional regulator n=1 Tax=Bartonella vinsonii TaxID=33047 RepID=A0A3S4YVX6_BARVI|nr:helix-turn-helix transcriptional regulator [Bartonella vinsonii]VEJ45841.1 anaerobic benzoate catabolism transcriptional regulator [Bartonella vinsonii]
MRGRSHPVGDKVQAKNPHFNDISVGRKIRFRRNVMGLSQKQLSNHLGVTYQQIQKYEKGLNRVGAGRLKEIADILDVPISFFYTDLSTKEDAYHDEKILNKAEYLLLKGFRVLKPERQKAILRLVSD